MSDASVSPITRPQEGERAVVEPVHMGALQSGDRVWMPTGEWWVIDAEHLEAFADLVEKERRRKAEPGDDIAYPTFVLRAIAWGAEI